MNDIIDFFISPYVSSTSTQIVIEIVAVFFGIASVVYAKKENILVFPTGIISTILYIYMLSIFSIR